MLTASRGLERRRESGRPRQVHPGDQVGRELPHAVADRGLAAGEGGSGELGEAARGREEERAVAARRPHADDDAVVEGVLVADVALSAHAAFHALAAPGGDARADVEPGPRVPRLRRRAGRQSRIVRRRVRKVGGERRDRQMRGSRGRKCWKRQRCAWVPSQIDERPSIVCPSDCGQFKAAGRSERASPGDGNRHARYWTRPRPAPISRGP